MGGTRRVGGEGGAELGTELGTEVGVGGGGGGEEANDRLFCVMESTTIRQDDTEVIPALNFLNNTVVPVGEVFENVVGGGTPPPTVEMKVLYLDEETRVSSLEDGSILLFKRVV